MSSLIRPRTLFSRRDLLGLAAKASVGVVVTQSLLACGSDSVTGTDTSTSSTTTSTTGSTGSSGSSSSSSSCVLTAALTEGPYFVDEKLLRSDVRTDPTTGTVSAGTPLSLQFNVARLANSACTPLTGAYLDVWHADATGVYSDESMNGTSGKKFLRGYQLTDANGQANFTTIYPGWYQGRAVHIHFKLRLFAGATTTYEFTSQFFLDEALTSTVHANTPYNTRGTRDTVNTTDNIYMSLTDAEKTVLTLQAKRGVSGYAGVIDLGVQVG